MISVMSGLVVIGAGSSGFWYLRARDGHAHPLALMPVLDWLLPTALVGLLAFGTALIISGLS